MEYYLPHFKAVTAAGVGHVMCAFNRIWNQPACANDVLADILYKKWKYEGFVVTDAGCIENMVTKHHTYIDMAHACAGAIKHGTQLALGGAYNHVVEAVQQGLLTEKEVDAALGKLFEVRFRLGMFDQVQPFQRPRSIVGCDAHDALSIALGHQTLTLLKNQGGLLPLKTDTKILLLGPQAEEWRALLGNYHSAPARLVNYRQGITAAGTSVTWIASNRSDADLVAAAKKVDVVVYVAGLTNLDEGEEPYDRKVIELPAAQTQALNVLKGANKPIVLVIHAGSCQAIPWEAANIDSILMAWYPGQSGGVTVADVLFGKYNPAGRTPVTWYTATSDLPDFSDYNLKGRTYLHYTGKVLWPFGYGLS
jgi:beta-glucosidase